MRATDCNQCWYSPFIGGQHQQVWWGGHEMSNRIRPAHLTFPQCSLRRSPDPLIIYRSSLRVTKLPHHSTFSKHLRGIFSSPPLGTRLRWQHNKTQRNTDQSAPSTSASHRPLYIYKLLACIASQRSHHTSYACTNISYRNLLPTDSAVATRL